MSGSQRHISERLKGGGTMSGRDRRSCGSAGPGIKICGLFRECDISYVNDAQPDYAGFILNFPGSHRNVAPERALVLRRKMKPEIKAVGVFVNQPPDLVLKIADLVNLDVIQLHGQEDDEYVQRIRDRSGIAVWKAFKVRDAAGLLEASRSSADEVLLDNGYGTGRLFDWSVLAEAEEIIRDRGFILAGGLTPDNIPDALRQFSPKIIDISSGVETDQVKDPEKIIEAVRAVRNRSKTKT